MTRPPRRLKFRQSFAQTLRDNQRGLDLYAAISDRPKLDIHAPAVRAARQPAQSPKTRPRSEAVIPLEREVQQAVLAFLRAHPAVGFCGRLNSGSAAMEDGRPIRFHGLGRGAPDIIGAMRRGCAWLAIEVKRPGAKPTTDQLAWLEGIRATGGCAGWVTCIDEAHAIITEWVNRHA